MTPEQHRQIGKLYHEALERPHDARQAFLDQACDGDQDLRRRVDALLVAHEQAGEFLEKPDPSLAQVRAHQTAPMTAAGTRFGQYEVISLIGAGGMGEVYLAYDARLGRRIALKLLPAVFTANPDRVKRFKQEARAASATNHPNIITIFDIGEASFGETSIHFIAVEYVEGQTLRQRLVHSPLKLRNVLDIALQTASALAAAHDAGVIHRDIKPENIMIRRDGYVKVLDFGLAKLAEKSTRQSQAGANDPSWTQVKTNPGLVMGTFAYMSPEQAQGQEVDARTDLFSLGCMLYEMISGRTPFEGASPAEMIAQLLGGDSSSFLTFSNDVPRELERIVVRALARNREERYQSAGDLLIDLKNLRLDLDVEARLSRASPDETTIGVPTKATTDATPGAVTSPDAEIPYLLDRIPDTIPVSSLLSEPRSNSPAIREMLEPVGGAVPLDSGFYIVRTTDEKFREAVDRQDSIVLVKGARQVGKTSLLARGLEQARESGARVVLTDFQTLGSQSLESISALMLELAVAFADQLDLDISPDSIWKANRSPGVNFEQYLRHEVLMKLPQPIVWGLDEVDRLFTCNFGSEVFGLFRSWHNKRALDPRGPWQRLTLAIAYATEAHLFITDLNQSPFNIGTRLQLDDFNLEQVSDLNERHGSPLKDMAEITRFYRLLSGHPYLVRRGLHEMVTNNMDLSRLEAVAVSDEGPFSDHLHRMLISLNKDAELREVVRGLLLGKPCASPESFYRLRSAGLAVGESTRDIRPRCQLYARYLERHLQ